MNFTDIEIKLMKRLLEHEVTSGEVKEWFGIDTYKGKALTKKNFPNIRYKLYSYMTAYHHGMYRGGFCWVSVINWKDGISDLREFINQFETLKP